MRRGDTEIFVLKKPRKSRLTTHDRASRGRRGEERRKEGMDKVQRG
jgi:hypothetical protein